MGKPKSEIINIVKNFKRKAAKKYGIKKAILFGSQATGKTRKWSDIDLLIVSPKIKKRVEFMSKLYGEWHIKQNINYPVDFICYTPEEFNRLSKQVTIVSQAIKEGIEI